MWLYHRAVPVPVLGVRSMGGSGDWRSASCSRAMGTPWQSHAVLLSQPRGPWWDVASAARESVCQVRQNSCSHSLLGELIQNRQNYTLQHINIYIFLLYQTSWILWSFGGWEDPGCPSWPHRRGQWSHWPEPEKVCTQAPIPVPAWHGEEEHTNGSLCVYGNYLYYYVNEEVWKRDLEEKKVDKN